MDRRDAPDIGIHETDRGFLRCESTDGAGNWGSVRVYESSGNDPAIWVKVHCDDEEVTASVSLEDAARLAIQLQYLVDNHFLGGSEE